MTLAMHPDLREITLEERLTRIDQIDLEPIAWALTQDKYGRPSDMTDDEADIAILHYKMTLKLWLMEPGQTVTLTQMIDEVWHTHILDSTKYSRDMVWALGYVPQHFPYFGAQGPVELERLMNAHQATIPLYAKYFGVDPSEASVAWRQNHDARMRSFYQSPAELVDNSVSKCGTVRCCNACNKVHEDIVDPTIEFGARMRRPGR